MPDLMISNNEKMTVWVVEKRGEGDSNPRGESPPVFKTGAVGQA